MVRRDRWTCRPLRTTKPGLQLRRNTNSACRARARSTSSMMGLRTGTGFRAASTGVLTWSCARHRDTWRRLPFAREVVEAALEEWSLLTFLPVGCKLLEASWSQSFDRLSAPLVTSSL